MIKIMYNLQIFYFHKHKTGFFSLIPCPYLKFIFLRIVSRKIDG